MTALHKMFFPRLVAGGFVCIYRTVITHVMNELAAIESVNYLGTKVDPHYSLNQPLISQHGLIPNNRDYPELSVTLKFRDITNSVSVC